MAVIKTAISAKSKSTLKQKLFTAYHQRHKQISFPSFQKGVIGLLKFDKFYLKQDHCYSALSFIFLFKKYPLYSTKL